MQFCITSSYALGDFVTISGSDATHIIKSLRMKKGDSLRLVDPSGVAYKGCITGFFQGRVECSINLIYPLASVKRSGKIILVPSLISNNNMSTVIQKSVEMGIDLIAPVISTRSNVRYSDSLMQRWKRVVNEAWKQSESLIFTEIQEVAKLETFLSGLNESSVVIYLAERSEENFKVPDVSGNSDIYIFVGPEGGYTGQEIDMFKNANACSLSLGESVLRSETACMAGVAVVLYALRTLS